MNEKIEMIVPDGSELNDGQYIVGSLETNHVVYRCATLKCIEEWLDSQIDGHPYAVYRLEGRTLKLVALRFHVYESEVDAVKETLP